LSHTSERPGRPTDRHVMPSLFEINELRYFGLLPTSSELSTFFFSFTSFLLNQDILEAKWLPKLILKQLNDYKKITHQ
jgi:hypothetical protein